MAENPGWLRIVEEQPDGIVVYGTKVAGSVDSIGYFFTLTSTMVSVLTSRFSSAKDVELSAKPCK